MVGIRDAVKKWDVSERALRRRLAAGDIADATRNDDGSWLLPAPWLDSEFDRGIIDLRDQEVSDGLAAVLSELGDMTTQVKEAEVRAAVAETSLETVTSRLRSANDELEHQATEYRRLQHDYNELQQEFAVQGERLAQAEDEVARAWATWEEAESSRLEERENAAVQIHGLISQQDKTTQKLRLAESMTSRRRRRFYQRLADELDRDL